MKAVVFSTGEPTTNLAMEALYRQGIDAYLYQDDTSFVDKMRRLCNEFDEQVLRVDADIIVNDNLQEYLNKCRGKLIAKPKGFLWWSQDVTSISVTYYSRATLLQIKENLHLFEKDLRPERRIWNMPQFDGKRAVIDVCCGIKGYGIKDLTTVEERKNNRGQYHDWEWLRRINSV